MSQTKRVARYDEDDVFDIWVQLLPLRHKATYFSDFNESNEFFSIAEYPALNM